MGKFLIGVATGFALTVLVLFLLVIAALKFREKPPAVADGSTLILRLNGEIPERQPVELPLPFLQDHTVTVANVWGLLWIDDTVGEVSGTGASFYSGNPAIVTRSVSGTGSIIGTRRPRGA